MQRYIFRIDVANIIIVLTVLLTYVYIITNFYHILRYEIPVQFRVSKAVVGC